jgi:hypothetical protein
MPTPTHPDHDIVSKWASDDYSDWERDTCLWQAPAPPPPTPEPEPPPPPRRGPDPDTPDADDDIPPF